MSIEGDQVVDWSRWCRQEGSWQGSVLDRSGFVGEKPVNKDIRFPSDVYKCRAFAKFCGKVSLRTRCALTPQSVANKKLLPERYSGGSWSSLSSHYPHSSLFFRQM